MFSKLSWLRVAALVAAALVPVAARRLAARFRENLATYAEQAGPDVLAAGPAA